MLSTELPITEWWDPEWDVYDVPGSPYDPVTPAGHAIWWTCYEHVALIEWITTGRSWGWPDKPKELDPPRRPPSWYPGQPDPPRHRPRPCSCEYVVDGAWHLSSVTRSLAGLDFGAAQSAIATWFVIHNDCPEHGDDAHA